MKRFVRLECLAGLGFGLLMLLSNLANAAGVHQHGLADAAVVVEGQSLTVSFRAPLMDILGQAERCHTAVPGDFFRSGDRGHPVIA